MHKLQRRYRYPIILLKQLVKTDFKLRYQGSILGYIWSLLKPLLLFAILYLVFTVLVPLGRAVPHYPVYLLTGVVLWNYFTEVTGGAVGAIVGRGDLLRKINFPKYIIILSGSLSALINLALNFVVIAIFMAFGHVGVHWSAIFIIPLLVELFILAIGVAFLLSAMYVKFRDITYIWEVFLQAAFYATPILYVLGTINHKYAKYIILNPMAQIIQDTRHILVTRKAATIGTIYGGDKLIWLIPISSVLLITAIGASYFRRRSKYFAEEV